MEKMSRWWLFDSHNSYKRSSWLHSTLSELDSKTKAMLKLIEEDGDTFAQRAEMYYKKRPELISMVEDFYRMHRSLAERYNLVRSSDHGTRLVDALGSPFSSLSIPVPKKLMFSPYKKHSESCSKTCEIEVCKESEVNSPEEEHEIRDFEGDDRSTIDEEREDVEVDNPEEEHEIRDFAGDDRSTIDEEREEVEVDNPEEENEIRGSESDDRSTIDEERDNVEVDDPEEESEIRESEGDDRSTIDEESDNVEFSSINETQRTDEEVAVAVVEMREELERLREENRVMNEQLRLKDDEKRAVIRQLSLAVELLKEENLKLKKRVVGAKKEESPNKPWSPFEFKKLKEGFLGKLVTGTPRTSSRVLTF